MNFEKVEWFIIIIKYKYPKQCRDEAMKSKNNAFENQPRFS